MLWKGQKVTQTSRSMLQVHEPVIYEIRVQGTLSAERSDYVGGMRISTEYNDGGGPVTTLRGRLLDQSALLGVLNFLVNRMLPLLSVEYLPGASFAAQNQLEDEEDRS